MKSGAASLFAIAALLGLSSCERPAAIEPHLRWRSTEADGGLAAYFGPSESDDISYQIVCERYVLTATEFGDFLGTSAPRSTQMVVREADGEVLAIATGPAALSEDGRVSRIQPGTAIVRLMSERPGLELALRPVGADEALWTPVNDVIRDVLINCATAAD